MSDLVEFCKFCCNDKINKFVHGTFDGIFPKNKKPVWVDFQLFSQEKIFDMFKSLHKSLVNNKNVWSHDIQESYIKNYGFNIDIPLEIVEIFRGQNQNQNQKTIIVEDDEIADNIVDEYQRLVAIKAYLRDVLCIALHLYENEQGILIHFMKKNDKNLYKTRYLCTDDISELVENGGINLFLKDFHSSDIKYLSLQTRYEECDLHKTIFDCRLEYLYVGQNVVNFKILNEHIKIIRQNLSEDQDYSLSMFSDVVVT